MSFGAFSDIVGPEPQSPTESQCSALCHTLRSLSNSDDFPCSQDTSVSFTSGDLKDWGWGWLVAGMGGDPVAWMGLASGQLASGWDGVGQWL